MMVKKGTPIIGVASTDSKLNNLVAEGRRICLAMNEMRATAESMRAEHSKRWDDVKPLRQALKDKPCVETAVAYDQLLTYLETTDHYDRMSQLDESYREACNDLRLIQVELLDLLGLNNPGRSLQ